MRRWFSLALIALLASGCVTTNKSSGQSGSLRLQDIDFTFSSFLPSEISVRSSGSAPTEKQAIDNALIAAVKQAMGVLIVSELSISQEKIVDDLAASYSSGVVKKYKKVECISGSRVTCTIDAVVTPWGIRNRIFAASSKGQIDGNELYGQFVSQKHTIEQRRKLAKYYFTKLWDIGFTTELESAEILPGTVARLRVRYTVKWNKQFRSELIRFINNLESDTDGKPDIIGKTVMSIFSRDNGLMPDDEWAKNALQKRWKDEVTIAWGTTLFWNEARILGKDRALATLIKAKLDRPVRIKIEPFNYCDEFEGTKFTGNRRPTGADLPDDKIPTREIEFDVKPETLKRTRKISLSTNCDETEIAQLSLNLSGENLPNVSSVESCTMFYNEIKSYRDSAIQCEVLAKLNTDGFSGKRIKTKVGIAYEIHPLTDKEYKNIGFDYQIAPGQKDRAYRSKAFLYWVISDFCNALNFRKDDGDKPGQTGKDPNDCYRISIVDINAFQLGPDRFGQFFGEFYKQGYTFLRLELGNVNLDYLASHRDGDRYLYEESNPFVKDPEFHEYYDKFDDTFDHKKLKVFLTEKRGRIATIIDRKIVSVEPISRKSSRAFQDGKFINKFKKFRSDLIQ